MFFLLLSQRNGVCLSVCGYEFLCIYVCMHLYVHICVCVYICVCIYTIVYMCVCFKYYVYMCIGVCVHMCTYSFMDIPFLQGSTLAPYHPQTGIKSRVGSLYSALSLGASFRGVPGSRVWVCSVQMLSSSPVLLWLCLCLLPVVTLLQAWLQIHIRGDIYFTKKRSLGVSPVHFSYYLIAYSILINIFIVVKAT